MILYHGTSTDHLPSLLQAGILPRALTGMASNFEGKVESKPAFVYLSDAYPAYFAWNAADDYADLVLVKVDVAEDLLYPDEDFIAFLLSMKAPESQIDLISTIDPAEYQPHWNESLRYNGTVATPLVPVERILDHRTIPATDTELILAIGGDSMPTVLNYRQMGSRYRTCVETFFDDGREAALQAARRLFGK
jgi:hypothetical protein